MRTHKAVSPTDTVASVVVAHPGLSRVFETMRIDYCCGGDVPLAQAATEKGVDIDTLVALLDASITGADGSVDRPGDLGTSALVDHIVGTHHAYLRRELPRLVDLATKVADAHGDADVRLYEVLAVMTTLAAALVEHLEREERELFPAMVEADGSIEATLHRDLIGDHQEAGSALDTLRGLTDGYTLPEWGCNTYRALLDGLEELERDTHEHVHLENNVLFPRFSRG
jgi:regulator of cell morphogenesis and NO signaling